MNYKMTFSNDLTANILNHGYIYVSNYRTFNENGISVPVLALQADLMQVGYMLSEDCLLSLSDSEAKAYYNFIINNLNKKITGKGNFVPFYTDFPDGVLNRSNFELLFNQLIHYWSEGKFKPAEIDVVDKNPSNLRLCKILDNPNFKVIKPITMEGIGKLIGRICSAQVGLSENDIEFIKNVKLEVDNNIITNNLPTTIPFKETLCLLMDTYNILPENITDILRYAFYKSNVPVTLEKNEKFKHFFNFEKRDILKKIDDYLNNYITLNSSNEIPNFILESAKQHKNEWIRLGEILHPGNYHKRYIFASEFFNIIRNENITTTIGQFNKANVNMDFKKAMFHLSKRPGEFARRLNSLILRYGLTSVAEYFTPEYASQCSYKVLYELLGYFDVRMYSNIPRKIMLKSKNKSILLPSLAPLSVKDCEYIRTLIFKALYIKTLNSSANMNNKFIYINENLKNIPLPKSMRTISKDSTLQIPRGTKIPFESDKYMRFYVHWIDEYGNEDLDLSALFYSNDFKINKSISWCSDHKSDYGIFSGDVRYVQGPCAEYVDINIDEAIKHGFTWLVMNVSNYEHRSLNSLPAWCGWMIRSKNENTSASRQHWAPDLVEHGFKLNCTGTNETMCIVNLKEKYVIVVDESQDKINVANIASNFFESIVKYYSVNRTSIYDIIYNNIMATIEGCGNGKIINKDTFNTLLENNNTEVLNNVIKIDFYDAIRDFSILYPYIYPEE